MSDIPSYVFQPVDGIGAAWEEDSQQLVAVMLHNKGDRILAIRRDYLHETKRIAEFLLNGPDPEGHTGSEPDGRSPGDQHASGDTGGAVPSDA